MTKLLRSRPSRCLRSALGALAVLVLGQSLLAGDGTNPTAPMPVVCGESAATLFSDYVQPFNPFSGIAQNKPVVFLIDNRIPGAVVPDPGVGPNSWPAAMFYNASGPLTEQWTAANLGQVFGVEFDNGSPPNIYVTATSTYGSDNPAYDNVMTTPFSTPIYPLGATGGEIYRLDGTNGNITLFATLPNVGAGGGSGPGLGNLCFDKTTNRFYVTNFHDGRIYSLDLAGNCKGTFHVGTTAITTNTTGPCPADTTAIPGFMFLNRRPWGVGVLNGRLYYSIWSEDQGRPSAATDNTIHSIALTATGDFTGLPQLEVTMPPFSGNYSNPVSDIAFSSVGRMMLAERVRNNDVGPGAQGASGSDGHQGRNLEYELIGSTWTATAPARQFLLGNTAQNGNNSEGGVDYDCEDNLWSTIDQMPTSTITVYGLQRTPSTGNTLATIGSTGYFIDLDQISTVQSKNRIGSVAMYKCCCMELATERLKCTPTGYDWTFCITNNSGQTANALSILTPPGVTLSNQAFALNPPMLDGETRCFTLQMAGLPAATEGCFTFILRRTQSGGPPVECCRKQVCITPPDCCIEVNGNVTQTPTGYQYCFTITNTTNNPSYPITHIFIVDNDLIAPPNFSPQYFQAIPPIAPFTTSAQTFCVNITGATPGSTVCFDIDVHDEDLDPCCYQTLCVLIPDNHVDCPCPDPCPAGAMQENEPCPIEHINDVCDPATATILPVPATVCGDEYVDLSAGTFDNDWWYFQCTAGATYQIGLSMQFPAQVTVLFIGNGAPCPGELLAARFGDPCTSIPFTVTAPGTGLIAINIKPGPQSSFPCECGNYSFRINQLAPAMCSGDADLDGAVGIGDVAMIIQHWGQGGQQGDANHDGQVTIEDIAAVIQRWGQSCP